MKFSPRQREIIVLVGRDGLQWESVARRLGISKPTVMTYVRRIMNRIEDRRPPRDAMVRLYFTGVVTSDDIEIDDS